MGEILTYFVNSSAVEIVANSHSGSLRFFIIKSGSEGLPHLMQAVKMPDNCLYFAGAREEDSMGSLSRSLFEISLLGMDRDCISTADREELIAEGNVVGVD